MYESVNLTKNIGYNYDEMSWTEEMKIIIVCLNLLVSSSFLFSVLFYIVKTY